MKTSNEHPRPRRGSCADVRRNRPQLCREAEIDWDTEARKFRQQLIPVANQSAIPLQRLDHTVNDKAKSQSPGVADATVQRRATVADPLDQSQPHR